VFSWQDLRDFKIIEVIGQLSWRANGFGVSHLQGQGVYYYIYMIYIYTYMYIHIYVYMPSHRIEPTYGIWWGSPTKYMIWDLIYDVWCISMYFNNVYHQMCPGGIRDLPWCGWNFVAWCPICQNIFVFICMGRLISINTRCCDVKHWTVFFIHSHVVIMLRVLSYCVTLCVFFLHIDRQIIGKI